jgi:biotin carboxyl carrier protein
MAGLSSSGGGGATRETAGGAPAHAGSVDPRAVRVRLAASMGIDAPSILVGPASQPLRMTNPTVGTGPLGGASITPEAGPDPGVLAQRQIEVDGVRSDAVARYRGSGRWVLETGDACSRIVAEEETAGENGTRLREVLVNGFRLLVETESERIASLRERASQGRASSAHSGPLQVKAIIPGKVVAVSVKAGDQVVAGQQLLVVEAMKMQNELRSPRDGTIERVGVSVGVNIEIGDLLVVIS